MSQDDRISKFIAEIAELMVLHGPKRPPPPPPQTAPAVPLPPEILNHIRTIAFDSLNLPHRQRERLSYTKVCSAWYHAFRTTEEFHVADEQQAGKLATNLVTTEQGGRVVQLDLDYQTDRRTFNNLIRLLNGCPNLIHLSFIVYEGEDEERAGPFLSRPWDRDLLHALRQLDTIENFSVNLDDPHLFEEGVATWSRSSFNSLLSSWQSLKRFHVENIWMLDDTWTFCDTLPRNVCKVWSSQAGVPDASINLMYCSKASITDIGIFPSAPCSEESLERIHEVWDEAAPNLVKASMGPLTSYNTIVPTLLEAETLEVSANMKKLEVLIIEVDPMEPVKTLNALALLPRLKVVTLLDLNSLPYPSVFAEAQTPFLAFAAFIATSRSLRSVTLSAMGRKEMWFDGDGDEEAKRLAIEHGVNLRFTFGAEPEDLSYGW